MGTCGANFVRQTKIVLKLVNKYLYPYSLKIVDIFIVRIRYPRNECVHCCVCIQTKQMSIRPATEKFKF